jgi:hypothetical protein
MVNLVIFCFFFCVIYFGGIDMQDVCLLSPNCNSYVTHWYYTQVYLYVPFTIYQPRRRVLMPVLSLWNMFPEEGYSQQPKHVSLFYLALGFKCLKFLCRFRCPNYWLH